MNKKNTFLSVLACFIFIFPYTLLKAQTSTLPQQTPKVVAPSPNAASLGKYGDIPVNLHTGIPNISIPIYEVQEGSIKLPVSLSYHASGIRVAEIASWVGLGWALNAGGVITRSIQHVPDEGPVRYTHAPGGVTYHRGLEFNQTGYYKDGYSLPSHISEEPSIYNKFQDAALGNMDTEPDIFFYNFAGYSGKFMFKVDRDNTTKSVTSRTPVFIPRADVKVEATFQLASVPTHRGTENRETFVSFTLITPDGMKYTFGGPTATEYSGTESYNSTTYEFADYVKYSASAWYLTRIEAPDGKYITLTYEADTYSFFDLAPERVYGARAMMDLNHQLIMRTAINGVKLKKITTSNMEVLFVANTVRLDLSAYENSGGTEQTMNVQTRRLDKILINKLGSTDCFKAYSFNYSYYECLDSKFPSLLEAARHTYITDKKRLKLESFVENSCDSSQSKPPYIFTYNSTPLPRRISFQQDHWGYYNGASENKSLIAFVKAPHNADRETSAALSQAGVLTSIKYPTGGSTNFIYESNEFEGLLPIVPKDQGTLYSASVSFNLSQEAIATKVIDVQNTIPDSSSTCAKFFRDCYRTRISFTLNAGMPYIDGKIYDLDYIKYGNQRMVAIFDASGQVVKEYSSDEFRNADSTLCPKGEQCTYEKRDNYIYIAKTLIIPLPPGQYTLKAYRIYSPGTSTIPTALYYGSISVYLPWEADPNYVAPTPLVTMKAGGLRIAKITDTDGLMPGKKIEKIYTYPTKGTLFTYPVYFYNTRFLLPTAELSSPPAQIWSSSSILSMQTSQGSHIAYGKVKVEQTGNGYSEYEYDLKTYSARLEANGYFTGATDKYTSIYEYYNLPARPALHHFERGNLLFERHYNAAAKLISLKEYLYEVRNNSAAVSIIATKMDFVQNMMETSIAAYTHYPIFTGMSRLLKQTETIYDVNGNNPLTTTTEYTYGSTRHLLTTQTTQTTSTGKLIEKMIYPPDYGTLSTNIAGISLLQQKNLINVPIEKYTLRENTGSTAHVISGTLTTYKTTLPLPEEVKALELVSPLNESSFNHSNKTANSFSPDGNYKLKYTIHSYDTRGNIQDVSKAADVRTVYLWGYKGLLPIAEIKNVTNYAAVKTALGQIGLTETAVLNLNNDGTIRSKMAQLRNVLPGAMISSYTYDVLKGMTSQTGPDGVPGYYSYDALGRLSYIQDQDQNIVKSYIYNYKR